MRPVPVVCLLLAFCPHSSSTGETVSISVSLPSLKTQISLQRTRAELGGRESARSARLVLLVERTTTATTAEPGEGEQLGVSLTSPRDGEQGHNLRVGLRVPLTKRACSLET